MATKKKLLQAAAGTAAASGGAGGLNVESVFSTYLYEGNGGSQVIENGINLGQSFGSGSAEFDGTGNYVTASSGYLSSVGTGDFTIEGWWYFKDFTARTYFARCWSFGTGLSDSLTLNVNTSGTLQLRLDDALQITASTAITTNTWYHIALCRNSGTTTLYIDGFSRGSFSDSNNYSTLANNSFYVGVESNGLGGYTNSYVSNIRIVNGSAVYTSNFNPSTSALSDISGTSLLTLQGDDPFVDNSSSPLTITKVDDPKASTFGPFDADEAGEGGLVWVKSRSASTGNRLFDTTRGAGKVLISDSTLQEVSLSDGLTSFNANGFSIAASSAMNTSASDYASWTFRKAPKFFDVVTFTVPTGGADQTISHNLDAPVGFVITKLTSSGTANWYCFHTSRPNKYLSLDLTSAEASWTWSSTNTDIDIGAFYSTNFGGETGVAYFFAHNDGDGNFGDGTQDIIKCGSFTIDGSGNASVDLGWEPQWLLMKKANSSHIWYIVDNMRGLGASGQSTTTLYPNLSNAEVANNGTVFITPTGFYNDTTANGNYTTSGDEIIYIAIRRGPMAVPTDATDVFAIDQGINASAGDRVFNAGFPVDLMIRTDPTTSYNRVTIDRLRGSGAYLITNDTQTETDTQYGGELDDMEGVFTDSSFDFSNHYAYMWQRRPKYFDVVAYTGNSTAGRTVSHNLGVAPEMMWIKRRDSADIWTVYHSALGAGKRLKLHQTTAAEDDLSSFNNTAPTSSVFTVGSLGQINGSGGTYIAYLFASLDGVSKVGSINHISGTDTNVDCGFSNGARFVLWKQTDAANSWGVVDVERGLVSGNDALLLLNTTDAETSSYDLIDPLSSGFVFTGTFGTGSYIFYAIA